MPQCLLSGKFKELLNSVLAYAYCSMHIDYNSVFGGQLSANYKNFSTYKKYTWALTRSACALPG